MALSEFEIKKIEKAAEAFLAVRRPAPSIRDKWDIGWRLEQQSVYIFETRPLWQDPSQYQDLEVAKATYVQSQRVWNIYWQRQDLKWHRYEPDSQVKTIEQVFDVINQDELGCFFG
ncbi:DUF3024 domain-containing protein [Shewanella sp. A3A]|nr:DUF3024 domain-containing protein [Shewanella ferrihydritica]